jgi:hypothetical protein
MGSRGNHPDFFCSLQHVKILLLASSTLNDMFTHFEQLRYLDFYTLMKLSVILPHGVCKITRKF